MLKLKVANRWLGNVNIDSADCKQLHVESPQIPSIFRLPGPEYKPFRCLYGIPRILSAVLVLVGNLNLFWQTGSRNVFTTWNPNISWTQFFQTWRSTIFFLYSFCSSVS